MMAAAGGTTGTLRRLETKTLHNGLHLQTTSDRLCHNQYSQQQHIHKCFAPQHKHPDSASFVSTAAAAGTASAAFAAAAFSLHIQIKGKTNKACFDTEQADGLEVNAERGWCC